VRPAHNSVIKGRLRIVISSEVEEACLVGFSRFGATQLLREARDREHNSLKKQRVAIRQHGDSTVDSAQFAHVGRGIFTARR
jgi:hypothetical protein